MDHGATGRRRETDMYNVGEILLRLMAVFVVVWLYIILLVQMVWARNRSAVIWVLISLVISPLLSIILLLALGNVPSDGKNGA